MNLRPIVRAMNIHADTYTAPAWKWIRCYLGGRRRFTVDDAGIVKIGREIIYREQQELVLDVLMALERERLGLPPVMHGEYRQARGVHADEVVAVSEMWDYCDATWADLQTGTEDLTATTMERP